MPLWFFENRSGRLQFLKLPLGGANGEPLEPGGWMITKGDGIMEACSIAYMFKNMPLKDWVAYSDKFGTPGVLGQTNAAKGSEAGEALKAAVAAFGQNWSGVVYGADGTIKEPISLITASGEGVLPFPPLVERMDRAMTALWRGSDLSTMSADNKGASVQEDESDILLADDAAMVSETLQLYIDRWVIWQKFGVRPLAYSKIVIQEAKDVQLDLAIDKFLVDSGARLGERERLEYYGRPVIAKDDTALHAAAQVTETVDDKTDKPAPVGSLPNQRGHRAEAQRRGEELTNSLRPGVSAGDLADVLAIEDEAEFRAAVDELIANGGPGSGRYPKGSGNPDRDSGSAGSRHLVAKEKKTIRDAHKEIAKVLRQKGRYEGSIDVPNEGPVRLTYGDPGKTGGSDGIGLIKIQRKHGHDALNQIPHVLLRGKRGPWETDADEPEFEKRRYTLEGAGIVSISRRLSGRGGGPLVLTSFDPDAKILTKGGGK